MPQAFEKADAWAEKSTRLTVPAARQIQRELVGDNTPAGVGVLVTAAPRYPDGPARNGNRGP